MKWFIAKQSVRVATISLSPYGRRIRVQHFYVQDEAIRWRSSFDIAHAVLFLNSAHDRDAHYARTDTISWVGYKAHLTETCDDNRSRLITHIQTCLAPVADHRIVAPAHEALADKDLLWAQHLVDTGYIDAGLLIEAWQRFGIDLIGPIRLDLRWRAQADGRFAIAAFRIDWAAERVTCPLGIANSSRSPALDIRGTPGIKVKFPVATASPAHIVSHAPARATRRQISLCPQARHEALAQARQHQNTAAFARLYAQCAGIKATLSPAVRSFGLRRARYAGLAKRVGCSTSQPLPRSTSPGLFAHYGRADRCRTPKPLRPPPHPCRSRPTSPAVSSLMDQAGEENVGGASRAWLD
ncbi:transposase [Methylobacterium nigriterrae]|uniref:transposase n=1 Tax=Methylobacterium nigriterrae TaxID=3127512 RepID=UPI003013E583